MIKRTSVLIENEIIVNFINSFCVTRVMPVAKWVPGAKFWGVVDFNLTL